MWKPAIGHVRYINILTWLRGFQVKSLYLVLFSLYLSLFWELRDKGNLKNLQFWPESLGAMLDYWYMERGLLKTPTRTWTCWKCTRCTMQMSYSYLPFKNFYKLAKQAETIRNSTKKDFGYDYSFFRKLGNSTRYHSEEFSCVTKFNKSLCISQIEASTSPPGHTPGIWRLFLPGRREFD